MLTQEFDLNMIPDSAPVVVHVNQYDIGEGRLIISLYKDSSPYNPATGATVVIQGMKADKHGFNYAASLSGNVVTADVTEQMTAAAGITRCQVVVSEGDNVTGTFVFFLDVQKSALPEDSDMSASDYQLVQEMINAAEQAEGDASESATSAAGSARAAATSENNAEAWAVGTRDGAPVPETDETYHNNSKYYAEQAATSETNAAASATAASVSESNAATSESNAAESETNAAASEENAEAWAVGQRGGEDVPSTDETHHNNSKYWAEQAAQSAARSGHTIRDNDGAPYTARTSLQFMDSVVADDPTNDRTIVYPAILTTYMGVHNDWFAYILDDDGNPILTDDDYAILADWQYKYT